MAQQLSMDQSTYCRIERSPIDVTMLERIAQLLATTPTDLQTFHMSAAAPMSADMNTALLQQKDELIRHLTEEVIHLRDINARLLAR